MLKNAFMSLKKQSFKDFEWIIIDDGSSDNTKDIVKTFEKAFFPIRYFYQTNGGKHIAYNNGVKYSKGEYVIVLDSDDTFLPYTLEILFYYLACVPSNPLIVGIKGTTLGKNFKINGSHFSKNSFLLDTTIENFIFKFNKKRGEMLLLIKKSVALEFLYPEIRGLHYFPETIVETEITKKYQFRFIDVPVRNYETNNDSLTNKKSNRYKENIFLWIFGINNFSKHFWGNFLQISKYYVGFVRDTLMNRSFKKDFLQINSFLKKLYCLSIFPVGFILYLNKKQKDAKIQ